MEKGSLFKIVMPNNVEVTAVVLDAHFTDMCAYYEGRYVAYAQNRLFTAINTLEEIVETDEWGLITKRTGEYDESAPKFEGMIADYCVIPEVDEALNCIVEDDL